MSTDIPASRPDRKTQRHASRTGSTYAAFIRHLCEVSSLDPVIAESAAVAVLGALERRIQPEEARQLEAQLPRRLVEHVELSHARSSGPRRFGREDLLRTVAEELRMSEDEVEPVVRAVFLAVRDQISEGESKDISAQLPADLRELWQLTQ